MFWRVPEVGLYAGDVIIFRFVTTTPGSPGDRA